MHRRSVVLGLCAVAVVLFLPTVFAHQEPLSLDQGGVGLALALRRLTTTARVLCVTAHPDDENNAVLTELSRGRGVSTALLTLTRGEGGQNAIGPELGESLGLLRTEELATVHRYDGVEQFFAHAYDFGYSFSLEETLARWGEEETLSDIVRVVRLFRPDIILSLPRDAPDHQHHVAGARLTAAAFRAAADPNRFPEQLAEGLRPWQARVLFEGGIGGVSGAGGSTVSVDTSQYDPVLATSWVELGSLARASHRSQGMRQLLVLPGEALDSRYAPKDAEPALDSVPQRLLDVIDPTIYGLQRFAPPETRAALDPGLRAFANAIETAEGAFDARSPHASAPALADAIRILGDLLSLVRSWKSSVGAPDELIHRLSAEETEAQTALALAEGISVEAIAEDGEVVPNQTFTVKAHILHHGPETVSVDDMELRAPEGWRADRAPGALEDLLAGQGRTVPFTVSVADSASPTRPYWHREPGRDRYVWNSLENRNRPFAPPELSVNLRCRIREAAVTLTAPVMFRYEGRWVGGEKRKTLAVVPELSVRVAPDILVFPTASRTSREVRVTVHNGARSAGSASVRLEAAPGWTVAPRETSIDLSGEDDEETVRFLVSPPDTPKAEEVPIRAVATSRGREFHEGYRTVAYNHIEERRDYREAVARALVLDVRTLPETKVGYVVGVGDDVPEALRQLGLPVTLLSADDIAFGDLSSYATIVLGVRAYYARPELKIHHARLMRFVENGCHLIVQYQRAEFNPLDEGPSPFAPYLGRVTTKRVTDETAPIEVQVADDALLVSPNRIGPHDWEGWIQERGIQLFEARDTRYRDLLASADPFPLNPGRKTGLLVEASVGKGTWAYVGLVLFRQLPAGVPGAYRLLANLVGQPRGRGSAVTAAGDGRAWRKEDRAGSPWSRRESRDDARPHPANGPREAWGN